MSFGVAGPTIMLKDGIDLKSLTKLDGTGNIEFTTEDFEASGPSVDDCQYFENMSKLGYEMESDSDSDADPSITWFQKLMLKMKDITVDGGVKKLIKKEGVGSVVPPGSKVRLHYNGYMEDLDEPFDSSRIRNKPLQATLGQGQMIAGLDVGVGTMRRNEVSRFLIEPSYAYGVMGCPPRIPSNAKVCFEVELLSYTDSTAIDDYQHLSEEEKRDLPFERLVKVSKSLNAEGNELYLCEKFGAAVRKYMKAINTMESATYKSEEEESEMTTICTKSYLNIGLSYLKTGSFGRALDSARKVLVLKPGHTKAMYLCGKAFRHLGEFPKSRIYLQRALSSSPRSKDIITELKLLDQMELNFQAVEKQMCKKMFT